MDCRTKCDGVFPQGEQCNIVPDNVDDIVADIAQEEKEEGLALLALLWYAKLKTQFEISGLCYLCSLYRPADDTPETCIYSNWSPWSACSSATCEKGKRMRQRMLKAQLDLSVPCPHTQDFEPCMGPGCSDEGEHLEGFLGTTACSFIFKLLFLHPVRQPEVGELFKMLILS